MQTRRDSAAPATAGDIERDSFAPTEALALVEKYETVLNYLYKILANVYGGLLDRHIQQDLGEQHWFRYMDDLVVLGHSSEHLRVVKEAIESFSRERMGLRFSKWSIAPVERGVNFLGYRIRPSHKLLRRDSVVRAKRKVAAYRANGDDERLGKFLAAWGGHASWADSRNLMRHLGLEVGE
jgi:hypothetical protein